MEEEEWKMGSINLTVSDTDVDIIIKNMKNRKFPGPGNINLENYNGISITNPFIKILGNLIKNWIEKRYKGNEEQSGFTKG
jgi:hypothetical protein